MKEYHRLQHEMVTKRLIESNFENTSNGWTKEACERTLQSIEENLERVRNTNTKYPAYLSVAIFVDQFPPKSVWDEFVWRVNNFANNKLNMKSYGGQEEIKITGFRQVEEKSKVKEKTFKNI